MDASSSTTTTDKKADFARRLTDALRRDGRPARQVALAAGIDPRVFHHYQTGQRYPKVESLRAIAIALRTSVQDLTGQPDVIRVELVERRRDIGKDEEALIAAWRRKDVSALLGFAQRAAAV